MATSVIRSTARQELAKVYNKAYYESHKEQRKAASRARYWASEEERRLQIDRATRWNATHPERAREVLRRWRLKNGRNKHLQSTYGITETRYNEYLAEQNGVCLLCLKPESRRNRYGSVDRLSVDHDHSTGRIRGLLCQRCNQVLGLLEENTELLRNMMVYINGR